MNMHRVVVSVSAFVVMTAFTLLAAPAWAQSGEPAPLIRWISGRRLHFGDLPVVAHGMERQEYEPMVGVQRAKDRKRMLRGVFFKRERGFARELLDGHALLFSNLSLA
jgi:hypothetical protein